MRWVSRSQTPVKLHGVVKFGRHSCLEVDDIMSSTFLLCGLMSRCEESAMFSNLSMNSMAKMPDMPEPMGRPSVWRNI